MVGVTTMVNRWGAGLCLLWAVAGAFAEPFWVTYEGDALPTEQGWFRNTIGPPAELSLAGGLLTLDSRASTSTADMFEIQTRPIAIELKEIFVVEWRVRVEASSPGPFDRDVAVRVVTPDLWLLNFNLNDTSLQSFLEPGEPVIAFEPGFHDFRVESFDLRTYDLTVDGVLARAGVFYNGFGIPRVAWGDGVQGARSLSEWDYFRFGIVPEPSARALIGASAGLVCVSRRTLAFGARTEQQWVSG